LPSDVVSRAISSIGFMKPPLWTSLALVTGLLLMLLGPLAVSLWLPVEAVWTNADAEQWSQASANLHSAIHAHTHAHNQDDGQGTHGKVEPGDKDMPDLAAAQKEFDAQQARKDASLARPQWLGLASRLLGVLLAAAGIGGYFLASRGGG
jgi:hypothetical protein